MPSGHARDARPPQRRCKASTAAAATACCDASRACAAAGRRDQGSPSPNTQPTTMSTLPTPPSPPGFVRTPGFVCTPTPTLSTPTRATQLAPQLSSAGGAKARGCCPALVLRYSALCWNTRVPPPPAAGVPAADAPNMSSALDGSAAAAAATAADPWPALPAASVPVVAVVARLPADVKLPPDDAAEWKLPAADANEPTLRGESPPPVDSSCHASSEPSPAPASCVCAGAWPRCDAAAMLLPAVLAAAEPPATLLPRAL
jgi:hypothetical protein